MAEDYYKTLGVRRGSTQDEIQKAYLELARKYHPDMNPDDKTAKTKFQEVQAAFDVLSDTEKREMYDRYGSSFETMGPGGPTGSTTWGAGPGGFQGEAFDFGEIFGQGVGQQPRGGFGNIFEQFRRAGGQGGPKRTQRGADLKHELQIPFNTAVMGGEAQITLQRATGKTETIAVKIPQGIADGKKIRVRGQGEPGPRGSTAGDILLTIRVAPHPYFQRRGNHLHIKVPVTIAEAASGAKIDVPTPSGTVALSVPAGCSSGMKLRIKGHGVSPKSGPPGDLLAEIQVTLPKDLSDADRKLLDEVGRRYPENPRDKLQW